jgi:hypothetical protein
MLKVIVMLDCNICGKPFENIATSDTHDPLAWKALAHDLEDTAENHGWSLYRSAHHCELCMADVTVSLRQAIEESRAARVKDMPLPF